MCLRGIPSLHSHTCFTNGASPEVLSHMLTVCVRMYMFCLVMKMQMQTNEDQISIQSICYHELFLKHIYSILLKKNTTQTPKKTHPKTNKKHSPTKPYLDVQISTLQMKTELRETHT